METAIKFTKRVFICTTLVGVAKFLGPKILVSYHVPYHDIHYLQLQLKLIYKNFEKKFLEVDLCIDIVGALMEHFLEGIALLKH